MNFSLPSDAVDRLATTCPCGLPARPPTEPRYWLPDLDYDPGPPLFVVVRYGEDPQHRRAVRLGNDAGWAEYGTRVNPYCDITPPLWWSRVGICWAGTSHPVVAAQQKRDGSWVVFD